MHIESRIDGCSACDAARDWMATCFALSILHLAPTPPRPSPFLMLPPSISLNAVHTSVVDTRKEGSHTDYAIHVQPKFGGRSDGEIVYRRFSAFLQLQTLARRHFEEKSCPCGGNDETCLLTSFLQPVFTSTEFPVMQGRLLGKNSKSVVRDRVLFLNAFLLELEEALQKCPPMLIQRCEKENCRLTKLLKSFYGCMDVACNRPQYSGSL